MSAIQLNSTFDTETTEDDRNSFASNPLHPKSSEYPLYDSSKHLIAIPSKLDHSEKYIKSVGTSRALAIGIYLIFILAAPWVFRFAVGSNNTKNPSQPSYGPNGNATILMETIWSQCDGCSGYNGVTLQTLSINVSNITYPSIRTGVPSIAIFASQDNVKWYNFYSPQEVQEPYISNWKLNAFSMNQQNGLACLGEVYSSYLVACLNVQNLANNLALGEVIAPPPFNDRCFYVEGICGVPCVNLESGAFPPKCYEGVMDTSDLITNITEGTDDTGYNFYWGFGVYDLPLWLRVLDWVVIITIFFDTFANILRFLPLLTGGPSELQAAKKIRIYGRAVLGTGTPIVSESEALFLRGLIGRTAAALHTVGSRHVIHGIYVDTIINESVEKKGVRLRMWVAWIKFITMLASMKIKDLSCYQDENGEDDSNPQLITQSSDEVNHDNKVYRYIELGTKHGKLRYDSSVTNVLFSRPQKVDSFKIPSDDDDIEGKEMPNFSPLQSPKMSESSSFSQNNVKETDSTYTMYQLMPMLCFLDGWLEQIKSKDAIYNYMNTDKFEALRNIINDAPVHKYFKGEQMQKIQMALKALYSAFHGDDAYDKSPVPEDDSMFRGYQKSPDNCFNDEVVESLWVVKREGFSGDWNIAWTYWRRARLNKANDDKHKVNDEKDDIPVVYESTRIKEGTIVFKSPTVTSDESMLKSWLTCRMKTYKVLEVFTDQYLKVRLERYPPISDEAEQELPLEIVNVELIERNRGKAGALNVWMDYLRKRGIKWSAKRGMSDVPTYAGVMDARHMIAEPDIFWNEALPFFVTGRKGKSFGNKSGVILVQYPQYFSNVSNDDFLDNKNSGYYTIWQTLRDCAKCITSSGTNAIWDISDPNFSVATTSRIEDTGTTQQYLSDSLTVHLPCFVAYGIAKNTEDYIEAVYRWSTGAVELWYSTVFSKQITDFLIIAAVAASFAIASFWEDVYVYLVWFGPVSFVLIFGYYEKSVGVKPLRKLNVSATIVLNTMYWISNLTSLVWAVLVPFCIAFLGICPIAHDTNQALTWAGVAILLRLPPALMTNNVVAMVKDLFINVKKNEKKSGDKIDTTNFSLVMWRSSQLYLCSFAYTLLSIISGTYTAFKARFYDTDNTMWASFKAPSNKEKTEAWQQLRDTSCFNLKFWEYFFCFIWLYVKGLVYAFIAPDTVTKYLAATLFFFQLIALIYSIGFQNLSNASLLLISIAICSLNVFLVIDITLLLMPCIGRIFGTPIRPEYAFALLSLVIVGSLFANRSLDFSLATFKDLYTQKPLIT